MDDQAVNKQNSEMVALLLNDKVSKEQILEVLQSHVVENHVALIHDLCNVLQYVHSSLSVGTPAQETVNNIVERIEQVLVKTKQGN